MNLPLLNAGEARMQRLIQPLVKIGFLASLVCGLAFLQANAAYAQHDHDHERKSVNPKTDKLWEKSDQAFHDGDYKQAVIYHRQIVELDPSDIESFSVAAWLLWSMGHKDAAIAHIERGLKVNGKNWNMWDEAGKHYQLQAGMRNPNPTLLKKAKEAFAQAVQLLPADEDKQDAMMLRRRLAHAAEKADDLPLSLATWQKLVADHPDDVVNKNNLARVERTIAEKDAEKVKTAAAYAAGGIAFLAFIGAGAIFKKRAAERGAIQAQKQEQNMATGAPTTERPLTTI